MSSLHNWTRLPTLEKFQDDFESVFEDFWIKLGVFGIFFLGMLSCIGLSMVTHFERSGQAGPFRTLVNQIISLGLDQMTIVFLSGSLLDVLRLIFGPLPRYISGPFLFIFIWSGMNASSFITLISVVKFVFICIYKSIPIMNDNFLSFFIFLAVTFNNFLALLTKYFYDEKLNIVERFCSGIWVEEDKYKSALNIGRNHVFIIVIVQICVNVPMKYYKYCLPNQHPNNTDLGSLTSSFIVGTLFMMAGVSYAGIQRSVFLR